MIKTDSDNKTSLEYSDDDINGDSFFQGKPKDEDEWEEDECSDEREQENNMDQPPQSPFSYYRVSLDSNEADDEADDDDKEEVSLAPLKKGAQEEDDGAPLKKHVREDDGA